jgi:hypothetical protein
MGKNTGDTPPTFEQIIEQAQANHPTVDPTTPFARSLPTGESFVDTANEPFKRRDDVEYISHSSMLDLSTADGRNEYDTLQTRIANAKDLIVRRDEIHWTKEGDCLALVQWVELKAKARTARTDDEDDDDDRRHRS